MVRNTRSTGGGSVLYPRDVLSIEDVPLDLMRAISHANKILDWYENLMEKDIPPEWMWGFDDLLNDWFEEVKAKRGTGGSSGDEPDNRTVVPLMENEEAKGRRG